MASSFPDDTFEDEEEASSSRTLRFENTGGGTVSTEDSYDSPPTMRDSVTSVDLGPDTSPRRESSRTSFKGENSRNLLLVYALGTSADTGPPVSNRRRSTRRASLSGSTKKPKQAPATTAQRSLCIPITLISLIIVVGIVLLILAVANQDKIENIFHNNKKVGGGGKAKPPTLKETFAPKEQHPKEAEVDTMDMAWFQDLGDVIQDSELTATEDSLDSQSSPHRAIRWMIDAHTIEDRDLTDIEIIQTYVLAVLYFAAHPSTDLIKAKPTTHATTTTKSAGTGRDLTMGGNPWMQDLDICQWKGIHCDKHGWVTHLQVPDQNWSGTIPTEIRGLKKLVDLDLSRNSMEGHIPPVIGELTQLAILKLAGCELTGTIPNEVEQLSLLQIVHLEFNSLDGPVPSMQGMSGLKTLVLSNNHFQGKMPSLHRHTQLKQLELEHNKLTGDIPFDALSTMESLEHFQAQGNRFSGSIASSIEKLVNLKTLDLSNNNLVGSLPPRMDKMKELQELNLGGNALTGRIPEKLGMSAKLKSLRLPNNQLTGEIPKSFSHLVDTLETIELHHNSLGGDTSTICSQDTSSINLFTTDCHSKVSCDCCTSCY